MRNELFTATRGQGAQLNGYRLRGSTARDLDGTILATGFPFKAKQYATTYINIVGKLFNECADFRRTGSAALDLAYVAAGCWFVKQAASSATSPVVITIC